MADYTITKTDGNTITVTQGTVDSTTLDITLIGKNYTGYGQALNQNELRILENFANSTAPAHPTRGQIWYDTSNKLPKIYTGTVWKNIGSATASPTAPGSPNDGDLWYNTTPGVYQLRAYNPTSADLTKWDLVGPDYTTNQGLSGQVINTIQATSGTGGGSHTLTYIYAGNQLVAIFSAHSSAFSPLVGIDGFVSIKPGLNLNSNLNALVDNSDKVDGLHASSFMRSDQDTSTTGNVVINGTAASSSSSTGALKVVGGTGVAGNIYAGGNIVAAGNVTGTNITGTLSTAAQPNITSVGTLSALTVTGNVSAGNVSGTALTGTLATAAQPNVTSLGTLTGLTVSGTASATTVSATTLTGTLSTAAQTNITSVGTLSTLTVTGNIASLSGNLVASELRSAFADLTVTPVGNLVIARDTKITSTTDSTNLTTGALIISGGAVVLGKLRANIGLYTDNLYYANGVAYGSSSGTVNTGTANRLAYYVSNGSAVSQTNTSLTYDGTTLRAGILAANVGYSPTLTLTYGTTVNWDTSNGQTARVTLTGNASMATPTNLLDGAFYTLMVIQDGTGNRTLSWSNNFKWIGGSSPDLSTTAGAVDFFTFFSDGTYMYEQGRAQEVA